jgi:cob(I)alamin adenosyltransferase
MIRNRTRLIQKQLYRNRNYSNVKKKAAIYTRTGDKGTSALYNGERRVKNDLVFNALGNTDELNACIGVAKEYCLLSNNGLAPSLSAIQSRLLDVGSAIATPRMNTKSEARIERTSFPEEHIDQVENWIDDLDAQLPQLKTFILPSGGLSSSNLHVARAVCRRAERSVIPLVGDGEVETSVQRYLNRLSDFFFTAARFAAVHDGNEETVYRKEFDRGKRE